MKHIVVLGAGVIGLSAAAECVRRGHRVTVIDREPARRYGCSFGNAGMIVPSHFVPLAAPGMVALGLQWMWNSESPFYIRPRLNRDLLAWAWRFWKASTPEHVRRSAPLLRDLNLASRELYAHLASEEEFGLVKKGLLMLCKTEQTLEEEAQMAAQARDLGVPAEVLDAKATALLDPGVAMDIAGSVYFPKDCHLQPERYMAVLEKRVRAEGGGFLFENEIIGWRCEGARIAAVKTRQGEIEGDEFILSGGSWSQEMTRELGLRIPLQAGKGYSITTPNPVELPQICAIFVEARVAITPMMNGALRFGGTMEIAGLSEMINPRRVEGILKSIPRYYPAFHREHFDGLPPWSGLRPCSPDGLPYIGRTKAASNLIVATGHSMMGISLAPITGELAAQLADNEPPRFAVDLLSPDRFA